jgi:hypothetical protein
MRILRLVVVSVAALAFAIFETGIAYVHPPDVPNYFWAGFSWVCLLFVAWCWWAALREK